MADVCLINWVIEQSCSSNCKQIIREVVEQQPSRELILYRGHTGGESEIRDDLWWSTTHSLDVAKKEFSKNTGSLFTIHVKNVPVLDVNRYATEHGFLEKLKEYASEEECILLGGGTFYDSPEMNREGVKDDGDRKYSTWYRIPPRVITRESAVINREGDVIERAMIQLNGIEEEVSNTNDLDILTSGLSLTNTQKNEIMRRLGKAGGTRKRSTRKRSTRKRSTRKRSTRNRHRRNLKHVRMK